MRFVLKFAEAILSTFNLSLLDQHPAQRHHGTAGDPAVHRHRRGEMPPDHAGPDAREGEERESLRGLRNHGMRADRLPEPAWLCQIRLHRASDGLLRRGGHRRGVLPPSPAQHHGHAAGARNQYLQGVHQL